ncbi:hypothetical protein, partial [Salmonella sp. SAL4443]|uniref:hypothetical protein n=1 Tax=Salmonella sp. SAL4443 TaxID=3159898 RepID=UPI00397893DB
MKGKAPAHADPNYYRKNNNPVLWQDSAGSQCSGMRYEMIVKAINNGGKLTTDTSGITVQQASEVVL